MQFPPEVGLGKDHKTIKRYFVPKDCKKLIINHPFILFTFLLHYSDIFPSQGPTPYLYHMCNKKDPLPLGKVFLKTKMFARLKKTTQIKCT